LKFYVAFKHKVTGTGLEQKQCGLLVGGGSGCGQDFLNSCGCGNSCEFLRVGLKFRVWARVDKIVHPAQDSITFQLHLFLREVYVLLQ